MPGIRRPLGIGAGGLAILCALPLAEAEAIVAEHADRYPKLSTLSAGRLRAAVAEGRERGCAFLDGAVYPGTAAVGVAIGTLAPMAAISVAAISARLDATRRQEVAAELRRRALLLRRQLEQSGALDAAAGARAVQDVSEKRATQPRRADFG